MEHYYVVTGNEFGVNLDSKQNFKKIQNAMKKYNEVKFNDFVSLLIYVNSNGDEKVIEQNIDN